MANYIDISTTDGTAVITLKRPPVNALNTGMMDEISAAFERVKDDGSIKRVVLKAGDDCRAFCAGLDTKEMLDAMKSRGPKNYEEARTFAQMLDTVASCGKPIIAVVKGAAIGAGTTLAVISDYVIATSDAEFAYPEIKFGQKPEVSGPYAIPQFGKANAAYIFSKGERFNAELAKDLGMVQKIVANDEQDIRAAVDDALAEIKALKPGQKYNKKTAENIVPTPSSIPPAIRDNMKKMEPIIDEMSALYADRTEQGRSLMVETTANNLAEHRITPIAAKAMDQYIADLKAKAAQAKLGKQR